MERDDSNPGAVNWVQLCKIKATGGLGIRDTHLWNMIAIGKLALDVSHKNDNMWVKWVSEVYVKDTPSGNYVAPNNASWVLKAVCTAKNELNGDNWLRDPHFSI